MQVKFKTTSNLTFAIFSFLMWPLAALVGGLVTMLLAGDIHRWAPQFRPMGFWQATFIYALLYAFTSGLTPFKKRGDN